MYIMTSQNNEPPVRILVNENVTDPEELTVFKSLLVGSGPGWGHICINTLWAIPFKLQ